MSRTDEALAELRVLDEAASPGPWEASAEMGYIEGPEGLLFKAFLTRAKSKRDGLRRLEEQLPANAQLASLAKGHLLRAMEALEKYPCRCISDSPVEDDSFVCGRCTTLDAFEDAILGQQEAS